MLFFGLNLYTEQADFLPSLFFANKWLPPSKVKVIFLYKITSAQRGCCLSVLKFFFDGFLLLLL